MTAAIVMNRIGVRDSGHGPGAGTFWSAGEEKLSPGRAVGEAHALCQHLIEKIRPQGPVFTNEMQNFGGNGGKFYDAERRIVVCWSRRGS